MELNVAEGRLSDMILPIAFSDSVPAKKTWTAGLHISYFFLFCCVFSDTNHNCGLKYFIFPQQQLSRKQIILQQKVYFHTGERSAALFTLVAFVLLGQKLRFNFLFLILFIIAPQPRLREPSQGKHHLIFSGTEKKELFKKCIIKSFLL